MSSKKKNVRKHSKSDKSCYLRSESYDDSFQKIFDDDNGDFNDDVTQKPDTSFNPDTPFDLDKTCFGQSKEAYDDFLLFTKKNADQGHLPSILALAGIYESGIGGAKNYKIAFDYYLKAAEMGDSQGQVHVGECYHEGLGVEKNYLKAIEWLELAAEQNDSHAMLSLGTIYSTICTEQAFNLAIGWFDKAISLKNNAGHALKGTLYASDEYRHPDYPLAWEEFLSAYNSTDKEDDVYDYVMRTAPLHLGALSLVGTDAQYDEAAAKKWLTIAAEAGSEDAKTMLNELKKGKKKTANSFIHGRYAEFLYGILGFENFLEKLSLLESLAAKGDTEAQYKVALAYSANPFDHSKATYWIEKGMQNPDLTDCQKAELMNAFSEMYRNDIGGKKNLKKSVELLKTAAQMGNNKALCNYALILQKGNEVPKDEKKAFELLSKAAEDQFMPGIYLLGIAYWFGQGVSKDKEKAQQLFNAFQKGEYPTEQYDIACLYSSDAKTDKDYKMAAKFFRLSANAGKADSQLALGLYYLNGFGVAQNDKTAEKWIEKAAQGGQAVAMYVLGNLRYLDSEPGSARYQSGIEWLYDAKDEKNEDAIKMIRKYKIPNPYKSR